MSKILLVEDDPEISYTMSVWLKRENYSLEVAGTGPDGLERLLVCSYDIVILDLSLPGMGGLEVLKQYRNSGGVTPVLILTGKSQIADKAIGLDTGADDYLTKPFDFRELSARLRALLRRAPVERVSNIITIRNLELDLASREVRKNGVCLDIAPREFGLLEFLMQHPDQIFSVEALIERVWEADAEASTESVRSAFKRLRQKIDDDDDSIIETLPKIGYRLRSK